MTETQPFEGDVLLVSTQDGGDIPIEDGQVLGDRAFNTAVYLSLFGGNQEDSGKIKNNKTWWGNLLPGAENERMVSRFQSFITAKPMTMKHIQEAINAAELDLRWVIDEGIADRVTVAGGAGRGNRFTLNIGIEAAGESIYENTFSVFWKVGIYGGV